MSLGRLLFLLWTLATFAAVAAFVVLVRTGSMASVPGPWKAVIFVVGFFGGFFYVVFVAVWWTRHLAGQQESRERERSLRPRQDRARTGPAAFPTRSTPTGFVYRVRNAEAALIRWRLLVIFPLVLLAAGLISGYFVVWKPGIGRNAHTFAFSFAAFVIVVLYAGISAYIAPWRDRLLLLSGSILRDSETGQGIDLKQLRHAGENENGLILAPAGSDPEMVIPWEAEGFDHLKEQVRRELAAGPGPATDANRIALAVDELAPLYSRVIGHGEQVMLETRTNLERFLLGTAAFFAWMVVIIGIILLWQGQMVRGTPIAHFLFQLGFWAIASLLVSMALRSFRIRLTVSPGSSTIRRAFLLWRARFQAEAFGTNTARALHLKVSAGVIVPKIERVYYPFAVVRGRMLRVGPFADDYGHAKLAARGLARLTDTALREVPEGRSWSHRGEGPPPFRLDDTLVLSFMALAAGVAAFLVPRLGLLPSWLL